MIAAILARHGLRTGAYLSPHLVGFNERIRDRRPRHRRRQLRGRAIARAARAAELVDRARRRATTGDAVRAADGRRVLRARRARASRSR